MLYVAELQIPMKNLSFLEINKWFLQSLKTKGKLDDIAERNSCKLKASTVCVCLCSWVWFLKLLNISRESSRCSSS